MAWFIDAKKVQLSVRDDLPHWKARHKPGQTVPNSGIYSCTVCGKEAACNESDPFPPQNHHQHPQSQSIEWKLIVKTE